MAPVKVSTVTKTTDATDFRYAESLITPWASSSCAPARFDYPRWVGYPVTRCRYTDIGATVYTYMLNADRPKLGRWVVTACKDAKAGNMRACIASLANEMRTAASYNIFPVAGYVPEPEYGGLCFLFRDGVTVWTRLHPHFLKPKHGSCGNNGAENELPLIKAGAFARIASAERSDYKLLHPDVPVAQLHWVDVTRGEYQKAWTSERNELISAKAVRAAQQQRF